MIEYIFVITAASFLSAAIYFKTKGGIKMVFMKKTPEQRLAEARKLVEEAKKAEEAKQEQKVSEPVLETNAASPKPNPAEIKELEEQVHYYASNYRGIFNPSELPAVTQEPMMAEIACLLFGCLTELKKIRENLESSAN